MTLLITFVLVGLGVGMMMAALVRIIGSRSN